MGRQIIFFSDHDEASFQVKMILPSLSSVMDINYSKKNKNHNMSNQIAGTD